MWRTFDVGSVVESLPVHGTLVAAGANGMGRPVRRALLATTPDQLRRVGPSELVVTTAATLEATGEVWQKLVGRLDAAQVAGLAVRLGPWDAIPAELRTAADQLALPVITFPRDAEVGDVTAAVLDALLDTQSRRLGRVLEIRQLFTKIALAGGGAADIASALHDLLDCPVGVFDSDGAKIVIVPPDTDHRRDVDAATGVRQSIRAGTHDYGEIVAFTEGAAFDQDQLDALEQASLAIAVRLAQASAVAEAQERFAAISLEELIAGHAGDTAEVAERAISFGWDLGRPRAVLLASIDPPTQRDTLQRALGTIAAAARATRGGRGATLGRGSHLRPMSPPNGVASRRASVTSSTSGSAPSRSASA